MIVDSMPLFQPTAGTPEQTLAAFIMQGRRMAEQNGVDFGALSWEVSELLGPVEGRPRESSRRYLHFTCDVGKGSADQPLPGHMADFTKAYCAHFLGRTQITGLTDRLDAFKHLFAQLQNCRAKQAHDAQAAGPHVCERAVTHTQPGNDGAPAEAAGPGAEEASVPAGAAAGKESLPITASTVRMFDEAVKTLEAHYSPDAAKNRACQLEFIARFLDKHGMARSDLANWTHGCRGSAPLAGTSGPEFEANAKARLPSPEFLVAVARSFARATRPADILVTGALTLLRCFPGRISAILNMQEDPATEHDDDGIKRLLVRLPGDKRVGPSVRWVSKDMTPIAALALRLMHEVTSGPRATKRWYDEHPDVLHLPGELAALRTREFLTADEASTLLGINTVYFLQYAERKKLLLSRFEGGRRVVAFAVVERHLLEHVGPMMRFGGRQGLPAADAAELGLAQVNGRGQPVPV